MVRATWKGTVLAESDETVVVEGSHYFPRASVDAARLRETATRTTCGWKGEASYFTVVVGDDENADAAWTYADPKPEAMEIAGRIAFWKGVTVED